MTLRLVDSEATDERYTWPDVYFTPAYGRAEEARGLGTWHCLVSPDGRWMLPFLRRELDGGLWDATSPYGYAGIYMDEDARADEAVAFGRSAVELLAGEGCVAIFLRRSPLVSQGGLPVRRVSVVAGHPTRLIRLSEPDSMWAAMEGRARTAIRKALGSGFTSRVRPASESDLDGGSSGFRALYDTTMRRLGAGEDYFFPSDYYVALRRGLTDRLHVAEVLHHDDGVVASALLLQHDEKQHYHLSGSSPDAARMGANNLLVWASMQWGHSQGLLRFFLGGGISGRDSLYKFKKSFGGTDVEFRADGYVLNENAYRHQVSSAAHRTGRDFRDLLSRGFFPAYRSV